MKNFFLKKIGINKNKIIKVNGSGINLTKYKKLKFNKEISNKYFFVGRLIADKGIKELVEAFKIFKKIENNKSTLNLIVMEDNDNDTSIKLYKLKKWINGSRIAIKKNIKNINHILKTNGCLILPSYSEGMSRSIMEAISSGRPVICSNINGCKEMVYDNFNGFLIKPRSINSIYFALKKFNALTLSKKKIFANNSRILAEKNRFDEKYVVSEYLNQIKNDKKLQ